MTCCSDAKLDATKRAGVCLACSLSCHENHELIELYTKRNFRCDCGNPKFNSHPCQFNPSKIDINEENKYNQNYSGIYCICHRPYPDPESTFEDEMIQCIICEDWLHASHLDAVVPPNDQYSEMICKSCMENNEFLHDYSSLAVTIENVDVDIINTNDVTVSNGHTSDGETSKENGEPDILVDDAKIKIEIEGNTTKKDTDDPIITTESGDPADSCEKQPTLESVSDTLVNIKEESKEMEQMQSSNDNEISTDGIQLKTSNLNSNNATQELPDKINSLDKSYPSAENNTDEQSQNINLVNTSPTDNEVLLTENEPISKTEKEKENLNNQETSDHTVTTNVEETVTINCSKDQKEGNSNEEKDNTDIKTSSDEQPEDILKSKNSEADISENMIMSDSVKAKLQDTGPEHPQLLNESDKVSANESKIENESTIIDIITKGNEMHEEKDIVNKNENQKDHSSTVNEVPNETISNTYDNKRKLSMDEVKDNVETKKVKVDEEKTCVRPKEGKRHFKGATFWPSSFRQKLCMCNECLSMYKDLSVLFLIDPEDTVSAYEMLGKERTEGSPSSQYEKGLQALSSLDRIQQINALTEYNKMRDKLLDFLKSFKDRREIVKEEDIKGFFAGMKPKREPDGVYFCR